ncbi:hypothetical protein NYE40_17700 [Paenibacillus sp. FSL W8-1187]|uniref:hypothetical protein n=1 Tax=Paenibacillus sp. FSL W8-1187 TaxID=2975339 RepID=UPI0030DD334D
MLNGEIYWEHGKEGVETIPLPLGLAPGRINDLVNAAYANTIAQGLVGRAAQFGETVVLIRSEALEDSAR